MTSSVMSTRLLLFVTFAHMFAAGLLRSNFVGEGLTPFVPVYEDCGFETL